MGFCPQCRSSGSLVEARERAPAAGIVALTTAADAVDGERCPTGLVEFDRVLGGGLVPGAAVLIGGEPGVGKSTLLLEVAARVAVSGRRSLIVSAEESASQIGLRARRIGAGADEISLLPDGDLDTVLSALESVRPDLVVIDSIQTMASTEIDGSAGGVSQVRECGARLVAAAKRFGIPIVLIGHVTKEGALAGPRVLEHAVDVVLYLEGDAATGLRFLRGLKNRFGPVHQVGFFEMGEDGLVEVSDPTGVLLQGWSGEVPGAVVFPAVHGRRPVLVEVQALVTPSATTMARRSVKGIDAARLHHVLAVLDRHVGLDLSNRDVYVSVIGGLRIREPAIDLALALAVVSSWLGVAVDGTAAWGEVGLTGEVRAVAQGERRRDEAVRLGFRRIIAPGDGAVPRIADALGRAGLLHDLAVPEGVGG